MKIVTFSLNETKNFTSKNNKFKFTLEGKIDKQLNSTSFKAEIPILQIKKKKVSCDFIIKNDQKAELKCDLDFTEYKQEYSEYNFKVTTIENNDNSIFLARINEISLINGLNEEEEKNNKVLIIVLSVVITATVGIGVGVFIYIYLKRKKLKNIEANNDTVNHNLNNNINNNNSKNKLNANDVSAINEVKEIKNIDINQNDKLILNENKVN